MKTIIVKVLRAITRRPYGIAYFKIGKNIYPKIVRFDQDLIRTKQGAWVIENDKIYFEKTLKSSPDETQTEQTRLGSTKYKMTKFQTWTEGFPIIFLDLSKTQPIYFENDKGDYPKATPKNIEATLGKEKAAAEWEMMNKQKNRIQTYLLVCILLLVVIAALSWFNFQNIDKIGQRVFELPLINQGV